MIDDAEARGALAGAVRAWGISRVSAQVGVAPATLRRIVGGGAMAEPTAEKVLRWCAEHARDARLRESAAAEVLRREELARQRRDSVPLLRRDADFDLYGESSWFKGSGS